MGQRGKVDGLQSAQKAQRLNVKQIFEDFAPMETHLETSV